MPVAGPFLAFQQMKPHISGSQVARQADQVVRSGSATVRDLVLVHVAGRGHADRKAVNRGRRISSDQVGLVIGTGGPHPFVEPVDHLDRETRRYPERYQYLPRRPVHRQNIRHGHHDRFIPQMLQREIGQVEMYTFQHQVGRNQSVTISRIEYGGVVSASLYRGFLLRLERGADPVDQAEFAQFGDLRSLRIIHFYYILVNTKVLYLLFRQKNTLLLLTFKRVNH